MSHPAPSIRTQQTYRLFQSGLWRTPALWFEEDSEELVSIKKTTLKKQDTESEIFSKHVVLGDRLQQTKERRRTNCWLDSSHGPAHWRPALSPPSWCWWSLSLVEVKEAFRVFWFVLLHVPFVLAYIISKLCIIVLHSRSCDWPYSSSSSCPCRFCCSFFSSSNVLLSSEKGGCG